MKTGSSALKVIQTITDIHDLRGKTSCGFASNNSSNIFGKMTSEEVTQNQVEKTEKQLSLSQAPPPLITHTEATPMPTPQGSPVGHSKSPRALEKAKETTNAADIFGKKAAFTTSYHPYHNHHQRHYHHRNQKEEINTFWPGHGPEMSSLRTRISDEMTQNHKETILQRASQVADGGWKNSMNRLAVETIQFSEEIGIFERKRSLSLKVTKTQVTNLKYFKYRIEYIL
ncbi:unnamed protein product [Protopolystoma xenopodis]|uniref:Uncharacterized protein n=1 Tax=Protopolystoma xenopodis TaxID=117903 RepID=A0A3S5FE03_9PLAT|nr:unnamed protein product [Protopolystoma xenopodis]